MNKINYFFTILTNTPIEPINPKNYIESKTLTIFIVIFSIIFILLLILFLYENTMRKKETKQLKEKISNIEHRLEIKDNQIQTLKKILEKEDN